MDKQILCRVQRKKTGSWISLILPASPKVLDELTAERKNKVAWVKSVCGDQFIPDSMDNVPAHIIDRLIESLAMETEPEENNGPDNNDSWPEDGGPNLV